ncbi:MAG: serine/threonine protein phosphatase [Bacteroidetes bacterium]|jgi:serine/threonine protein phosphatase 1|nr:serine/threonine protein phosphatase [Bacteroidota bacterium]
MPQFAISDIHGCAKTFDALLNEIQFSPFDELYLLGDYIDRGPDSKGVLDRIMQLQQDGYQVQCLMGNHEKMVLDSVALGWADMAKSWMANGGRTTLQSFGLQKTDPPALIPDDYLSFLSQMGLYKEVDGYILVHAGLTFDGPDPFQDHYSMLWIRDFYDTIDYDWLDGRVIIHGHTPRAAALIKFQLKNLPRLSVLNIDAGCVFERHGRDSLCAFNMTDRTLTFMKNQESTS